MRDAPLHRGHQLDRTRSAIEVTGGISPQPDRPPSRHKAANTSCTRSPWGHAELAHAAYSTGNRLRGVPLMA